MNRETTCRYCPRKIRFVTTKNGEFMPVDATPMTVVILDRPADGWKLNSRPWARVAQAYLPHFASCPGYPGKRRSPRRDTEDFQAVLPLEDPTKDRYP